MIIADVNRVSLTNVCSAAILHPYILQWKILNLLRGLRLWLRGWWVSYTCYTLLTCYCVEDYQDSPYGGGDGERAKSCELFHITECENTYRTPMFLVEVLVDSCTLRGPTWIYGMWTLFDMLWWTKAEWQRLRVIHRYEVFTHLMLYVSNTLLSVSVEWPTF